MLKASDLNKRNLILIVCFTASLLTKAQQPAFYRLSTAEGLSDNSVSSVVLDHCGMMWIGTSEGLNSFDGNQISRYDKYRYPEIPENLIERILVDKKNQIWLRTSSHYITMLDENRKFHRFLVGDSTDATEITGAFVSNRHGLIVTKGRKHYFVTDSSRQRFVYRKIPFEEALPLPASFTYYISNDRALYYIRQRLIVADYANMKITLDLPLQGLTGANYVNDDELIAFTASGIFYRISCSQKKIIQTYTDIRDQQGLAIQGPLRNCARISESQFAFTTYFSGLYLVDFSNQTALHHEHDPANPRSIGGNNTLYARYDSSGYLFVTTQTSGLNFYNLKEKQPFSKPYFMDQGKNIFDGYIQSMAVTDRFMWLGAQDRLIKWDRQTDQSVFIPLILPDGRNISGRETIRRVFPATDGRLIIGSSTQGLLFFNPVTGQLKQLSRKNGTADTLIPSNQINAIAADNQTHFWVGTPRGIVWVDQKSHTVQRLTEHPVLSVISKTSCTVLWPDRKGRMWIGSMKGAWCYDPETGQLKNYSTQNGLVDNTIYAFQEDQLGNMYIATQGGLSILGSDEQIKNFNRSNGLPNDRCEGLLRDANGYIWIGNLNCLIRYDPVHQKFAIFQEGVGFNHAGFRIRSALMDQTGKMYWGTDKGLLYFYPDQLNNSYRILHPFIHGMMARQQMYRFTRAASIEFPFATSSFVFYFSSGELTGDKKNQIRYRLRGFDEDWQTPVNTGQAFYNRLPPGHYTFEIKASADGINWQDAPYPVQFSIHQPWWQTTWFRLAGLALAISIFLLLNRRYKRKKQLEAIQDSIDYFANSNQENVAVRDIFWDICRNCVSRLGFEDCVIYTPDTARNVLIQQAAYGPKQKGTHEIANPIEIPIGKGIVGHVASTGKPLIIADTDKDPRYIVDDEHRKSELTVPVMHEGKLLAVIDSEHRKKNFYQPRHLKALQTIASLCAARIARSMAFEAMQKSREELLLLNMKMAETKFMNLRLQMNPHFLFNSLSSIQHLIVSGQTQKAYRYLTVFSNFLRSLLNFAEKNFILLEQEIKIMTMYIELESLRFDESFSWEIKADDSLLQEVVSVPSLLIQPFAENAIWHGLLHKDGPKKLTVHFKADGDESLTCIIEDNGIGRAKALEIREQNINARLRESKGISIIKERLALLQQKTGEPASIEFEDLYDEANQPAGTRVRINIPYYNPEEI